MERHGPRSDGRQQIVGILGGQQQDQVLGRLFQGLQQRVRGLLVGPIDMVDQENAARSVQRLKLRALLQQAHLLDGDLPQRAVGRKGQEVGMRGEQQRIFVALVGWPFFALRDDFGIRFQAEIVLLDFVRSADHRRRESPRQRGFAHSFRTVQQNGLRDALLLRHREQCLRDFAVTVEMLEGQALQSPTQSPLSGELQSRWKG